MLNLGAVSACQNSSADMEPKCKRSHTENVICDTRLYVLQMKSVYQQVFRCKRGNTLTEYM
uniref:Uncharacterized protein n=1 Tax=Megaselia scalaris TaxID=36166 RepID=T1GE53_MEGSC